MQNLSLTINGENVESLIDPSTTLQKFLHDTLGMTGTKEGCGSGMCGCCTVMVDGKAVKSCLILALQVRGKAVQLIGRNPEVELEDSECIKLATTSLPTPVSPVINTLAAVLAT